MAAPATMAVPNVNGIFHLNKNLSDPQEEMGLKNLSYVLRQIAKKATFRLEVKSYPGESPPRIILTTGVSKLGWLGEAPLKAAGLSASKVVTRPLDGTEFVDEQPMAGRVVGRMWVARVVDLKGQEEGVEGEGQLDEFLVEGWEPEDQVFRLNVRTEKEGDAEPWVADHVWGFQITGKGTADGEARRYVGKTRVTKVTKALDEKTSTNCKLVYDFVE
ncbi:hypothetical protein MN608_05109 [Microdochium nivale]|nr:hypothetical protein MN608_05109 [Microdochium nivale]